jgi:hypothetical protein
MQQGHRQQHAYRQANHVVQILAENAIGEPAGGRYGKKAAGHGGQQDPEEQHG